MTQKPAYIVIEGAQGVGKTTIARMVVEKLEELGVPTRLTHEPDGDYDGTTEEIRRITQDPTYPMNSRTEVLLYNAARSQSLGGVLDAKSEGISTIADRSYLTTLAVQFYGRNDIQDYGRLNDIIGFAVHGVWPDLTVVLDAPVDTLKKRALARGEHDRFDNLDPEMLERIRAGYLWEAKQRNMPVVYSTGEIEETFEAVWRHVAIALGLEKASVSDPVALADVLAKSPAAKALKEKIPQPSHPNETEYYVPQTLPDDIQCDYCDDIERILSARRKLATKLAGHLAKSDTSLKVEAALIRAGDILTPLLPVACEPSLQPLIDQSERIPVDREAEKLLPPGFSTGETGVRLIDVRPRNELELVPYMLYESLDLPLVELKQLVDGWSYEVKYTIFSSYLAAYPQGKALSHASYEFDCFTDMQAVASLPDELRENLALQQLTPRYGYDMPKEVEEAELTDEYDAIFDMSLQLQSSLQARRFQSEAQYATLLGHKQRWHLRKSALSFNNLHQNTSLGQMLERRAEAHPLFADVPSLGEKNV